MIIFLLSCAFHRTNLTAVVDYVSRDSCTVELNTGDIVVIRSSLCRKAKEGDVITFYGSSK